METEVKNTDRVSIETDTPKPVLVSRPSAPEVQVSYLEGYRDGMMDILQFFVIATIAVLLTMRVYAAIER